MRKRSSSFMLYKLQLFLPRNDIVTVSFWGIFLFKICVALGERWGDVEPDVCQKNENNVKLAEKNEKYNNKNKTQSCGGVQTCYNILKIFLESGSTMELTEKLERIGKKIKLIRIRF